MSVKFQLVKFDLIYDFYCKVKSIYAVLRNSVYSQYNNSNLGFLLKERFSDTHVQCTRLLPPGGLHVVFTDVLKHTNEEEGSRVQATKVYWRAQKRERNVAAILIAGH